MMVGPDLLVAPVFEPGQRERRLYLPAGTHAQGWFDFWSGQYWPGGSTVTVDAALERLPLFVRAGSLLPTTDTWDDRALTEEPSRALRYYPPPVGSPASTSTVELFEDDGLQAGNQPAKHRLLRFDASANDGTLSIGSHQSGTWTLPYTHVRIALPTNEHRRLDLPLGAVTLTPAPVGRGQS